MAAGRLYAGSGGKIVNLKVLLPSLILTITFVVVLASGFGNNPHEVPFCS